MEKIKKFVKTEVKICVAVFIVLLIFFFVFLFANLDFSLFYLSLEIVTFCLLIYLFICWVTFKKKENLQEQVNQLLIENRQLKNTIDIERKDLEEYFLLWVHQIKTPITVSDLILQKEKTPYTCQLKEQMFYIREYTNMAINYMKLKDRQADMDIAEVEIDQLLKSLLRKYSGLFIDKNISLDYQPIDTKIITDARWATILIEQILANALKYTNSGKITLSFDRDKNALKVKDTGIGIKSEDINKIFDRGYSGFNGRINEKSSGIGLYLVKKIAILLNIKIEVCSTVNVGSEFIICFPKQSYNFVR
ncbi:HAMP domain-containing sensor histidine kinase [Lactobacillus iners]|jgi:ATPase/histidine kinase/DNA gyrase B/HSP90 domain protein|uniref:sensor histidine kinase n=1 Tax=Lactobacillus iners TaxID=147802 RepID=UPI0001E5DD91|nr:sensor histidine kinase [Lactobacillus iners]EFO71781.1 ATPase/histidine kinase/DNA gyrase B/HSP90 domain protein [Lactobacillus iners SPIN 2503V10-D]MCT7688028.1 sensor histidine kinase [Lactobacillus crispatus]MCT7739256.1 sensor histidine kinase [Lactobacillus iners]MCT7747496.1 sensor histidine kinase [Lactobacillus iners]MCT7752162.1 sensor histidine kinase [Lactobacillus iners]